MVEAISSVDRTIALEHFSGWEQKKASELGLPFLYKASGGERKTEREREREREKGREKQTDRYGKIGMNE